MVLILRQADTDRNLHQDERPVSRHPGLLQNVQAVADIAYAQELLQGDGEDGNARAAPVDCAEAVEQQGRLFAVYLVALFVVEGFLRFCGRGGMVGVKIYTLSVSLTEED